MSIFRLQLEVGDTDGQRFESLEALVDTGATFTTVPATLLERLDVPRTRRMRLRLADNRIIERAAGETSIRLDGQTLRTIVLFGEEGAPSLLGVYTLEAALLAVDPVGQRLIPTEALLLASE